MRLTPLRIYIDTSVFGGVYDDEFAEPSVAFFALAEEGQLRRTPNEVIGNEDEEL